MYANLNVFQMEQLHLSRCQIPLVEKYVDNDEEGLKKNKRGEME